MKINLLDSKVYNLISAGEVIERPASIVKELLENSLDANSKNIILKIFNGGINSILIDDDGDGIPASEIEKVFLPHATSKVRNADDLNFITTLGFRGEAMASIASVSKVTLSSKNIDEDIGSKIIISANNIIQNKTPFQRNNGTSVFVENLFYNVPARKKFLKKSFIEENEITQLVKKFILSNPTINFKYYIDDKLELNKISDNLLGSIFCVYDTETTQNISYINYSHNSINIDGYISKIGFFKPNTTYQTLIVNNRYVIDETVSKAVYTAFEPYLMKRQFPFFVLNINLPVDEVDINVHPAKLNIKFADSNEIFDTVHIAIRNAIFSELNLNKSKTVFGVESVDKIKSSKNEIINKNDDISKNNENYNCTDDNDLLSKKFDDDNFRTNNNKKEDSVIDKLDLSKNVFGKSYLNKKVECDDSFEMVEREIKIDSSIQLFDDNNYNMVDNPIYKEDSKQETIDEFNNINFKIIGELFSTYILLEIKNELWIVDFHAAHERLNYDIFMQQIKEKKIVQQPLILPYIYTLNNLEMNYFHQINDNLLSLGFEIDIFGKNDIRISSIPLLCKELNIKEFIFEILSDLKLKNPKTDYQLENYIAQKACKSSVRAGQRLNYEEIVSLLNKLDINNPVLLCPHGRPLFYKISEAQIEKWFKRIV